MSALTLLQSLVAGRNRSIQLVYVFASWWQTLTSPSQMDTRSGVYSITTVTCTTYVRVPYASSYISVARDIRPTCVHWLCVLRTRIDRLVGFGFDIWEKKKKKHGTDRAAAGGRRCCHRSRRVGNRNCMFLTVRYANVSKREKNGRLPPLSHRPITINKGKCRVSG